MYYNMGDLEALDEPNSILNLEKAAPYLANPHYDLPLDIALPIFSWGVLFREGKMIKLLPGNGRQGMEEVTESTYLDGYYLYAGDIIRWEAITPDLLQAACQQLRTLPKEGRHFITFYH